MNLSSSLTLPVTDVKQRLLELLKKVETYHDRVTITKNGVPTGVLMSIQEFESLMETLEILGNPLLMKSLMKSKAQMLKNKFYEDEEVWD